jgi:hypothetical protein
MQSIVILGNVWWERETRESPIETKKKKEDHTFINPFIAIAAAKLDLAIILNSFVTSGIA